MNKTISSRSGGREPDNLELKLSGSAGGEALEDVNRGREVEVTVRGTIHTHAFTDKMNKEGYVEAVVKTLGLKVDELLEFTVLTIPRRTKGQTAFDPETGEVVDDKGEAVEDDGQGEILDAEIAGELEAGDPVEPEDAFDPDAESTLTGGPPRHPQIPEEAWAELDNEQRDDVLVRVAELERLVEASEGASTPTDRQAAIDLGLAKVDDLKAEFGIELIPAGEVSEADDVIPADEPPPLPVAPDRGPVSTDELYRRLAYLRTKRALPKEALEQVNEEVTEIGRRLKAQE